MFALWVFLTIFAVILVSDFVHGKIYGFDQSPKMIYLPGFSFSYLIEPSFYSLFYAAVISIFTGPFYEECSENVRFSMGTTNVREDWMGEGFGLTFTGWVFWRSFITYTR